MTVSPQCGEIWLLDDATVLPGGMVALVVSGHLFNAGRDRRIMVEVVSPSMPSQGALLVDVGTPGVAVIGEPMVVPLAWFPTAADAEPVATLEPELIDQVTDGLHALIGRRP